MKIRPIHHRIMLLCALLLGMVVGSLGADPTNPRAPAPKPGPRFERESGFFSRLFGQRAGWMDDDDDGDDDDDDDNDDNDDDDDDDDEIRFRFRGPQLQFPPPPPGRIIIPTRTRNGAPIRSEFPDPNRYPRVPEGTRIIGPPAWPPLYIPRGVPPSLPPAPPVYFEMRHALLVDQTPTNSPPAHMVLAAGRTVLGPDGMVVVPTGTILVTAAPPPLSQFPVTPAEPLSDPLSMQPPFQDPQSAFPPGDPVLLPAPALPPGLAPPAPSSTSFAAQPSVAFTPSPGPPSVIPPSAEPPAPSPLPPFATPVPGRPGLVYPPGLDAIPENMVDVTYLAHGTKVRDPASKIVFRVP